MKVMTIDGTGLGRAGRRKCKWGTTKKGRCRKPPRGRRLRGVGKLGRCRTAKGRFKRGCRR